MHELAVTESLLNMALEYAEKNQAQKVIGLNLTIGSLSGIIDESVQFYWDMLSEGTICQSAVLVFDKIPARMHCLSCGHEYILDQELIPCPECQSMDIKVISGSEFFLESIEIER
jgi:hydrogenase nickel incorporation protein HypA/HybF